MPTAVWHADLRVVGLKVDLDRSRSARASPARSKPRKAPTAVALNAPAVPCIRKFPSAASSPLAACSPPDRRRSRGMRGRRPGRRRRPPRRSTRRPWWRAPRSRRSTARRRCVQGTRPCSRLHGRTHRSADQLGRAAVVVLVGEQAPLAQHGVHARVHRRAGGPQPWESGTTS